MPAFDWAQHYHVFQTKAVAKFDVYKKCRKCFLVFLSATSGQCQINLKQMGTAGGKYPRLIIKDGDFLCPTSQVGEEAVLDIREAGSLELFCHGTKK